jgi:hypothetical protein
MESREEEKKTALTNPANYLTVQVSHEGYVPHEGGVSSGFFYGVR